MSRDTRGVIIIFIAALVMGVSALSLSSTDDKLVGTSVVMAYAPPYDFAVKGSESKVAVEKLPSGEYVVYWPSKCIRMKGDDSVTFVKVPAVRKLLEFVVWEVLHGDPAKTFNVNEPLEGCKNGS